MASPLLRLKACPNFGFPDPPYFCLRIVSGSLKVSAISGFAFSHVRSDRQPSSPCKIPGPFQIRRRK